MASYIHGHVQKLGSRLRVDQQGRLRNGKYTFQFLISTQNGGLRFVFVSSTPSFLFSSISSQNSHFSFTFFSLHIPSSLHSMFMGNRDATFSRSR